MQTEFVAPARKTANTAAMACCDRPSLLQVRTNYVITTSGIMVRLLMPMPVASTFAEVHRALLPERRMRLLWVRNTGRGPAFYSNGTVVVGQEEFGALVDTVVASAFARVTPWAQPGPRWTYAQVWRLILALVIAHEIGHAVAEVYGWATRDAAEEAGADLLAGSVAEILGIPEFLGQTLFALLGCEERLCSHPNAETRANAFSQGMHTQRLPVALRA